MGEADYLGSPPLPARPLGREAVWQFELLGPLTICEVDQPRFNKRTYIIITNVETAIPEPSHRVTADLGGDLDAQLTVSSQNEVGRQRDENDRRRLAKRLDGAGGTGIVAARDQA